MISKRNIFFVLCFLSLNALVYFIRSAHVLGFMKTAKHVSINQDQQRTDEKTPDLKEQIWPTYSGRTDLRDVKSSKIKQDSKKKNYKIVLYHFYHNLLKGKARRVDMYKCNVNTNCEISHQNECSEKPIDADAVVYQGNHMPRDLPRRLNSEQAFVYLNIESPQYLQIARLTEDRFQYFFNWTMSYRFDSDIPYLYGSVVPRHLPTYVLHRHSELTGRRNSYQDFLNMTNQWPQKSNGIEGKDYEAIFQKKTKWSVWFVSHCRTASQRERYVIEMQKLTHVDIFGNCSLNTNICPKTQKNCSGDIQNVYKFVLAFENSLCEDYVTEKVFNRYGMDIITVVYGAQNYSKYLPKATYIDANDFATPADLAKYMNYVGSNKDVYLDYLKRKDQYRAILENEQVQIAYCTLCYRLNNLDIYRKQYKSLAPWWNAPKTCNNPTILDKLLGKRRRVPQILVPK